MAADGDRQRLALPDDDDKALPAGDCRIYKVPGEHGVVLFRQRDHHGGIFRSLRLVDRRGVGGDERVEFAERIEVSAIRPLYMRPYFGPIPNCYRRGYPLKAWPRAAHTRPLNHLHREIHVQIK